MPPSSCCSCSVPIISGELAKNEICVPTDNLNFEIVPDEEGAEFETVKIVTILKTIFSLTSVNFETFMCHDCAECVQKLYLIYKEFEKLIQHHSSLGRALMEARKRRDLDVATAKEEINICKIENIIDDGGHDDSDESLEVPIKQEFQSWDEFGVNCYAGIKPDLKIENSSSQSEEQSFSGDEHDDDDHTHEEEEIAQPISQFSPRKVCPICSKSYANPSHLQRHWDNVHPTHTFPAEPPPPYKCEYPNCSKSYVRRHDFDLHSKRHDSDKGTDIRCPTCSKTFRFASSLSRHISLTHKSLVTKYRCPEDSCSRTFARKDQLVTHHNTKHATSSAIKLVHSDLSNLEKELPNGSEDLKSKIFLRNVPPTVRTGPTGRKKARNCVLCGKSVTNMGAHLKTHKDPEDRVRHPCDICGSTFATRSGLTDHVESLHKDVVPHLCHHCGKSFKRRRDLGAHVKLHEGVGVEKQFGCDLCGKMFSRKSNLKAHGVQVHKILQVGEPNGGVE